MILEYIKNLVTLLPIDQLNLLIDFLIKRRDKIRLGKDEN